MNDKQLRPYYAYDGEPESGTVLVFDYNVQNAKVRGYKEFPATPEEYISFRCNRAPDEFMFFAESDRPHVVDNYEGDYDTWQIALEELSKKKGVEL